MMGALLLMALCSFSSCNKAKNAATTRGTAAHTDTTALLVMRVRTCARLYTAEMQIHKLVTQTDDPRIQGQVLGMPIDLPARMGHRSIAIPIDVTLKAYIDLAQFSASNVQRTDNTLVITLPNPQVIITGTRVDNKGTRQYVDALRSRYTDAEISQLAHQGTDSITAHLSRYGLEEYARQSATRQLVPLLTQLGYKESNISLQFAQPITDNSWKMVKQ